MHERQTLGMLTTTARSSASHCAFAFASSSVSAASAFSAAASVSFGAFPYLRRSAVKESLGGCGTVRGRAF